MALNLFKEEVDESEFVTQARTFLDGIRNGLSEHEAAARAGVPAEEILRWRRDGRFRWALKRAKRREGIPHVWDPRRFEEPEDPHTPPPPGSRAADQPPLGSVFGPMSAGQGRYK